MLWSRFDGSFGSGILLEREGRRGNDAGVTGAHQGRQEQKPRPGARQSISESLYPIAAPQNHLDKDTRTTIEPEPHELGNKTVAECRTSLRSIRSFVFVFDFQVILFRENDRLPK